MLRAATVNRRPAYGTPPVSRRTSATQEQRARSASHNGAQSAAVAARGRESDAPLDRSAGRLGPRHAADESRLSAQRMSTRIRQKLRATDVS